MDLMVGSSSARSVGGRTEQALICGPGTKLGTNAASISSAGDADGGSFQNIAGSGGPSGPVGNPPDGLAGSGLSPKLDGSIPTLVPYGESDDEVALLDDDIAFCLRAMFASPGVPSCGVGEPGPSRAASPVRRMFATDEEYARELAKKLENKEIEANDVIGGSTRGGCSERTSGAGRMW